MRELKHVEEVLLRSSPSRLLVETANEFKRLEEEFKRVVAYKLEQLSSNIPALLKNYRQSVALTLQQKEQHL